jgi:hypothetical protein
VSFRYDEETFEATDPDTGVTMRYGGKQYRSTSAAGQVSS